MRITWRDGVTTLAAAGAIALERAYFHNWDWPLVADVRRTIISLAMLIAVSLFFGFAMDEGIDRGWSMVIWILGLSALVITTLGTAYEESDYIVLLMINAVAIWVASILHHLTYHEPMKHYHA